MWAIIGTWRMALEGIELASNILKNGGHVGDWIEAGIKYIEDYPYFKSVGYGSPPIWHPCLKYANILSIYEEARQKIFGRRKGEGQ